MIRITKTKTFQYAWLYLMLLIPGSCAMSRYLNTTLVYGVIIAIYALLALLSAKYRNVYVLSFCLLLALATIVIRLKTGGVGPLTFLSNAAMLVVTYIAMTIDRRMFLTRFIRIVCFFGIISVLFWARVNGPLCFMEKDSGFTRILKYTQPVIVVSTLSLACIRLYSMLLYSSCYFGKRNYILVTRSNIVRRPSSSCSH